MSKLIPPKTSTLPGATDERRLGAASRPGQWRMHQPTDAVAGRGAGSGQRRRRRRQIATPGEEVRPSGRAATLEQRASGNVDKIGRCGRLSQEGPTALRGDRLRGVSTASVPM